MQRTGQAPSYREVAARLGVAVRAQPWVEHGAIGVVVIDEDVTVKTVVHRRHGLWLKPENRQRGYPRMRPRPDQRVRVAGNVIAVVRPLARSAVGDQRSASGPTTKSASAPPPGGCERCGQPVQGRRHMPLVTLREAGRPWEGGRCVKDPWLNTLAGVRCIGGGGQYSRVLIAGAGRPGIGPGSTGSG